MPRTHRNGRPCRIALIALAIGALAFSAAPQPVWAEPTSEEIAQEREGLEEELAEVQERLAQLEGEIEEALQELEESKALLDATRDEVDETKVQIDEATQLLAEKREALGRNMRGSYKMGLSRIIDTLLGATSFEDLVSRIYYLDKINEARAEGIQEVNRLAEELAKRQKELEEAQARQQEEVEAFEAKADEYETMIAEAQAYRDGLDEDIQRLIEEEEAARAAEEEAARKAEEEAAAAAGGQPAGINPAIGNADPATIDVASPEWNFDGVSSVEVAPGEFEQQGAAMLPYSTSSYSAVSNQYFGFQTSTNYQHMGNYNSYKQRLSYSSGDMSLEFETLFQLPVTYHVSADLGNPQAMCITPDGSAAYIAYPDGHSNSHTQTGFIVRYDLAKMREYGATSGDMSAMANGVRLGDSKWRSCMTIGPRISMGHGQCMAIDPSTGRMWLSTRASSEYSDLTLIDQSSLTPVHQIRFHTGDVAFGSVLTFDEYGNFYYVKRSGSSFGAAPAGSLRIYQGRISPNLDKVRIRLLPQGVRYPAGSILQGVSWDPTSDTLYVVNDSALLSVQMSSLLSGGGLSAGNVRTEFFSPFREYEYMAFDSWGTGYILVNRQAEIMVRV